MLNKLAEIRRLYFEASRATIQRDVARAVEILKSIASEEDREKARVYMDGLSQMRSEWAGTKRRTENGKRQTKGKDSGRR